MISFVSGVMCHGSPCRMGSNCQSGLNSVELDWIQLVKMSESQKPENFENLKT